MGAWLGDTPAAWMTPVMSPRAVAVSTRAWTESREDTSTVVVLTSNPALRIVFGCRLGVGLAQVGEHDVLAGADAPGDGLADQARSDDDDDVAHELLPLVLSRRMVTGRASGPVTWPTGPGPNRSYLAW